MKPSSFSFLTVALLAIYFSTAVPVRAYIGPGAGAGAIAVTLALGVGLLLLVVGLVWYPLKRMLKRRKGGDGQPKT